MDIFSVNICSSTNLNSKSKISSGSINLDAIALLEARRQHIEAKYHDIYDPDEARSETQYKRNIFNDLRMLKQCLTVICHVFSLVFNLVQASTCYDIHIWGKNEVLSWWERGRVITQSACRLHCFI